MQNEVTIRCTDYTTIEGLKSGDNLLVKAYDESGFGKLAVFHLVWESKSSAKLVLRLVLDLPEQVTV